MFEEDLILTNRNTFTSVEVV